MNSPRFEPLDDAQVRALVHAARAERARVVAAAVRRVYGAVVDFVRTVRQIAKAASAARLGNVH